MTGDVSGEFGPGGGGEQGTCKPIGDYISQDATELALSTGSRLLEDVKIKDDDKTMSLRHDFTTDSNFAEFTFLKFLTEPNSRPTLYQMMIKPWIYALK